MFRTNCGDDELALSLYVMLVFMEGLIMYRPDIGSNGKIRDWLNRLKNITIIAIIYKLYTILTKTLLIFLKSSLSIHSVFIIPKGFVRTSRCAPRLKSIGWIFKISVRQAVNHECGVPAPVSTHTHTRTTCRLQRPARPTDGYLRETQNPGCVIFKLQLSAYQDGPRQQPPPRTHTHALYVCMCVRFFFRHSLNDSPIIHLALRSSSPSLSVSSTVLWSEIKTLIIHQTLSYLSVCVYVCLMQGRINIKFINDNIRHVWDASDL